MPIRQTIYHPDRVVIGIATGEIALVEFVAFAKSIADAGLTHWPTTRRRKTTDARRPASRRREPVNFAGWTGCRSVPTATKFRGAVK